MQINMLNITGYQTERPNIESNNHNKTDFAAIQKLK